MCLRVCVSACVCVCVGVCACVRWLTGEQVDEVVVLTLEPGPVVGEILEARVVQEELHLVLTPQEVPENHRVRGGACVGGRVYSLLVVTHCWLGECTHCWLGECTHCWLGGCTHSWLAGCTRCWLGGVLSVAWVGVLTAGWVGVLTAGWVCVLTAGCDSLLVG